MNWSTMDTALLAHWRKLGTFRQRHVALARGEHRALADAPFTFSRVDKDSGDRVVVAMNAAGSRAIVTGDTFPEGTKVRDAYPDSPASSPAGAWRFAAGRWVLLERAP